MSRVCPYVAAAFGATILALTAVGGAIPVARAQLGGAPENSRVEVSSAPEGANLRLAFKVLPKDGIVINHDAPWKLEVKGHEGLTFAKDSLGKADLNETLPGFVLTTSAAPKQAKGELEYALTAFVCTANKTSCYREVHKGKASWQTAAK